MYSDKYRLVGKIDMYDSRKKMLVERKKHVSRIYDGYVFQLYGQYYSMIDMGYAVDSLRIHSIDDNKKDDIFLYIQRYYRFFMKRKSVEQLPTFELH